MKVSRVIPLSLVDMYVVVSDYVEMVNVCTKYKTIDKKVNPADAPLPTDSFDQIRRASKEAILRDPTKIGHKFTDETKKKLQVRQEGFLCPSEEKCFKEMLESHGKAFAFDPSEIGCVNPGFVESMIIFTVTHVPWNLKPIPMPRAHILKLIELFKEKLWMGILESSRAPYSNCWFTVPKKNGSLRFIQDLQPVNKVTIRNSGIETVVDEFMEPFCG